MKTCFASSQGEMLLSTTARKVFNKEVFEIIPGTAVRISFLVLLIAVLSCVAQGQQPDTVNVPAGSTSSTESVQSTASPTPSPDPPAARWHYGGFFDAGYLLDFNHPENRVFRSRGTTWHVDRPQINMAAFYLRKKATEESRWGVELTAQGGKDAELFGFSATAPNISGYKFLRQLGPTNVSYLAPIGKGLMIQGGIFSSFIGYDSLYAKDNFNYTRPWGADFTPYLMMGVNATYPFTKRLTGTVFVVNGYWHLANANSMPSFGGQIADKASEHWTLKETPLVGPQQGDTSLQSWRWFSDSIAEWKRDPITTAFEYQVGTERVATDHS